MPIVTSFPYKKKIKTKTNKVNKVQSLWNVESFDAGYIPVT